METDSSLARQTSDIFLTWPLAIQILVILLPLMLWVPGYFLIQLIKECSCWQERRRIGSASDEEITM
jgi:hypothetical protein